MMTKLPRQKNDVYIVEERIIIYNVDENGNFTDKLYEGIKCYKT